jgi:hypothetical protein
MDQVRAMLVTIESFWPESTIVTRVVPGILAYQPKWTFRTVNAGPWRSSTMYVQHIAETVGSSFDDGDEFRFGTSDGVLRSVILIVPDRNSASDYRALEWLRAPSVTGILELCVASSFSLNPADCRTFFEDGEAIVCTLDDALRAEGERQRVSIACDLDLLFLERKYCGWILWKPVSHLVSSNIGDTDEMSPGEVSVVDVVREYLSIVADPNIEKMEDQDEEVRRLLLDVRRRAFELTGDSVSVKALRAKIDDLLENFYGTSAGDGHQ